MWDMCIPWLVVYVECRAWRQRFLLSCDAQPRMKAVYRLSCVFVEAFLCLRLLVVGHWLAVFLIGALSQDLAPLRGDFVYRSYRSISTKWVATQNGCLCSEIGMFSHMSCEVELFYDHSCVNITILSFPLEYWVFWKWVWSFTYCPGLWTSWVLAFLYYTLVHCSVIVSWAVE